MKPIRIFKTIQHHVLPLYQGFIDEKTKLPVTDLQILNSTINSASKWLFEKQNITLKRDITSVGLCNLPIDHGIGRKFGGTCKKYRLRVKRKEIQ
jgi:hypothetical protein